MCFRGTHVRLHPSGHGLGTEHNVVNLLVDKVNQSAIYLFRIGHGEGLDVHLILDAGDHDLVLRRIGYFTGQPFAVGIALTDRLSMNDRLSVGVGEVNIIGHRELFGEYQWRCGRKKPKVTRGYQHITTAVGRIAQIPMRLP